MAGQPLLDQLAELRACCKGLEARVVLDRCLDVAVAEDPADELELAGTLLEDQGRRDVAELVRRLPEPSRSTGNPPFLEGVRRRTHPEGCTSICRISF